MPEDLVDGELVDENEDLLSRDQLQDVQIEEEKEVGVIEAVVIDGQVMSIE